MRISTSQIHAQGIKSILNQQAQLTQDQINIATGKRILTPADDPVGAAQIVLLRQQVANSERFNTNADLAETRLNLEDDLLGNLTNVVQRVRELHIQASSDTLGDQARAAIVEELQVKLGELVGLANTQDANGDYMFGGYQNNVQPYTQNNQGDYVYNGDAGQRYVEIAEGLRIPVSDAGFTIFENVKSGNGTFTVADTGAANTGSVVIGTTSITNVADYVQDTYTISFVTNSSGDLAYQVVGATSGQIIPALPATVPADAPAFQEGQAIQFNGIEIQTKGTPAVGDDFQVAPSTGQSLFTTVKDMISALQAPYSTNTQRASVQTQMNQSLHALDQALDQIIATRTKVGARLNTIDSAKEVNSDFILHSQATISEIEDLDYAEAISRFEANTVALQAAQQSFIKIRGLSLFNYLR